MNPIDTAELRRQEAIFLPHESNDLASSASSKLAAAALRIIALATGCAVLAASTNAIIVANSLPAPDSMLISLSIGAEL